MADVIKLGNIVSPNGASVIFGAESTQDNRGIEIVNTDTYLPYDIVIVEEDADETIPAEQITFSPDPGSALTGETVQNAINELEQVVYNNIPSFIQETCTLTQGGTLHILTNNYNTRGMMVFYNGLLINRDIHYQIVANNSRIGILLKDFVAEEGDNLTVIGLSSSGGGSGTNINAASLIGGSY